MLKLPNGHEYKLVYLDTNAISEISKNCHNCFKNFFEYFNFFNSNSCQRYALITTVYNMIELNKAREEYKSKIIEKFDFIPVFIAEGFPQLVSTELNKDDFIMFATGVKPLLNNQFSTIFNQLNDINDKDKSFKSNLNSELSIWNNDRIIKKDMFKLFENSYSIYNTYNHDYKFLYNSKSAKIFSYIKYHFLYEKKQLIDENSIIDSYNASLAPFVDVYVGERTVTSWLEKSKDKYDFMTHVECIKISKFYDKI